MTIKVITKGEHFMVSGDDQVVMTPLCAVGAVVTALLAGDDPAKARDEVLYGKGA
jgi:hypothetical protein